MSLRVGAGPVIAHRLGCPGADVHETRGVTKSLWTCRNCSATAWVVKP